MDNVIALNALKPVSSTEPINIMVDLETLGISVNSTVLSIGAVVFDKDRDLGDEFYVEINPVQGRNVDISTIKWWMHQTTPCPINGEVELGQAMQDFVNWLLKLSQGEPNRLVIWANGTNFDISILESVFGMFGTKPIWKYNNVRDYRTIAKTFSAYGLKIETVEKHNALEDAKWQAKHLCSILNNLSERLTLITP